MDAKDLRIETALGDHNDGSKYPQSGVALQCSKNKSYQDIGTNPLAKAEVTVRPCAVIGPDRVVPPASNEAYHKKAPVDLWPCPDNLYPRPPEYPYKSLNVNPSRNISPRQTYQENMQRIMVPPTYSAAKHAVESNLNHVQDRNVGLSKSAKQTMAPDSKYCDVPYAVNLLANEHKNVREPEICVPSVNSPLTQTTTHGWPPSGVNLLGQRTYSAHEVYQYPQYPSCAGPRPPVMPMARPHRTFQEDASYVYHESYYQDANVRFKPYPSVKERYPQARYDYISNYPNPFHPPPPYGSHKYDIPNTRPHPYPVYPHLKYIDNRLPDHNIEGYQRPNQQSINYNMQFRNQVIHPSAYAPTLGNPQNKVPSYLPDASIKSSNKMTSENNKAYVDYEHAKTKYSLPDSYFMSEMARAHQVQKPMTMPNYSSPGVHPVPLQQYHRKDNIAMKPYEYMPHYRHFEHPIGFNPPQFSPSTLAISPADSNTSNDTTQTQGTQEDCGYVSQSSTTSARSVDFNINRLHNEYYRRYDYRYRPNIGNSHMLPKSDLTPANSKENKKIDVRQFLSMWNEGDEETNNGSKEVSTSNNNRHHESAKSQDQLYVLGLVNVPSEELAKYEHIQKVSKLPENIKGYNSIELLNQFEEVIESSNMNSFKSSTTKDFIPMKDRKNAIKQIVEVLPRPVSPLDVEAKISQSVIHKEVGCNFEIKPCSPKMLNVEIAAPVQNVLGERAIEKVSNPLSNKTKSTSSMRIDGNTVCNIIQKQEMVHTVYENVSCKMVGSPFTANNMESVKTNYSMHDLETNSGVCLASLPRLDNEIELNFPEVNQQFINANKGSSNIQEKYPEEVRKIDVNLTISSDNAVKNDLENYTNASPGDSGTELTKLSKYRKAKVNNIEYPENDTNANATRTDSVIIENPENVRKSEEITYSHKKIDENENTPINLTAQNSSHLKNQSNTINCTKPEISIEGALDFSLSKSENGLPLLNTYDDELIKTTKYNTVINSDVTNLNIQENVTDAHSKQSKSFSEIDSIQSNTKSIIVRNNQSVDNDHKINLRDDATLHGVVKNYAPGEIILKLENYTPKEEESNSSDLKANSEIILDEKNKVTVPNINSTNVIVKHKHKKKSKKSKAKFETKIQNSLIKKSYHEVDCQQTIQSTTTVIQNSVSNEYEKNEVTASDICKNEVENIHFGINKMVDENLSTMILAGKTDIVNDNGVSEALSTNEEAVKNDKAVKIKDSENKKISNIFLNNSDNEVHDAITLICDRDKVMESSTGIVQANKYYTDLISEKELLVDKTSCEVNRTLRTSFFVHNENAPGDVMKTFGNSNDLNSVEQQKDAQIIVDTTDYQALDKLKTPKTGDTATGLDRDTELLDNAQCHIDKGVLVESSFDDTVLKNTLKACKIMEENIVTENKDDFHKRQGCENASSMVDSMSNETEIVDKSTTTVTVISSKHLFTATPNTEFLEENKYSIDSGYQSNKNSCTENDESIIGFPENLSEDSVFIEPESQSNEIALNERNKTDTKDMLHVVFEKSNSSNTLSSSANMENTSDLDNNISKSLNTNNTEKKTMNTNDLFDRIDANMQMLFEQPNEELLSDVNVIKFDSVNIEDNNLNFKHKVSTSENKFIDANPKTDTLFNSEQEFNKNDEEMISSEICNVLVANIEVDSNAKDESDAIDSKHNSIPDSLDSVMVTDEPCTINSSNEVDTEVHAVLYTKKCSVYRGKKLHSPWIQKLIMYNEGILNTKEVTDLNKTKLRLVDLNISNILKTTSDDTENKVRVVGESKVIEDAYANINGESANINTDIHTNNYINTCNDEFNSISRMTTELPTKTENKPDFENDGIEDINVKNNLVDTQGISFSYPNNSIISQITEDIFHANNSVLELKQQENSDKVNTNCRDTRKKCAIVNRSRPLKRSFSDSALNVNIGRGDHNNVKCNDKFHCHWAPKRNRLSEIESCLPNNRRNSVNVEENVSFCILIDDNCIITDENGEENEEKICIAELQEEFVPEIETGNETENTDTLKEFDSGDLETNENFGDSEILNCQEDVSCTIQDTWIDDITCAEDVFSDEVAENVVISALSSPNDSASEYEYDESITYGNITSCSHTDKVKLLHRQNMSEDDAQIVDTLYRTPHMDIMNKTLLYGDKNVESEDDTENIILESDDWKPSPIHTPDYIDPTQASPDFRLETPENKENVFVKELSPLRTIDAYLDVSSAENENEENILLHHVPEFDKTTQDNNVYSCESSLDMLDYKLNDKSINPAISTSSCSPEVSSTTSEEKNSSILLKITNMNGSRVSQINEIETIRRPRCKFTENKEYSTSNLNFPNRPLITKGAQKYIPPIKESIRDLKVKINLPQQSLLKLKQLKLSRNEPKIHKQTNLVPRIAKKPKPNFDDVLKSIDEIQIKRHKEKSKKTKAAVPKVVIKKNENGSHYASTPKRDTFSPDLTGRKWQPWVFLEKNRFIDKMAIKNTTKAIFSHRKNTFVLAEKFKKYKSVSSAKFVISQPKTPGQLKYTIRLKHTY